MKGSFKESGTGLQLVLLCFICVISTLIFGLLGFALSGVFSGDMAEGLQKVGEDLGLIKLNQIFTSSGLFLLPPFIFWYMVGDIKTSMKFNTAPRLSYFWALLLLVVSKPFIGWLMSLNFHLHLPEFMAGVEDMLRAQADQLAEATMRIAYADDVPTFMLNLFVMAILPAFAEEFFFRGTVQNILAKGWGNHHYAIIATSLIFSAIHFNYYGFLPIICFGLFLGYIYHWTNSIWPPIAFHFFNNGLTLAIMQYFGEEMESSSNVPEWPSIWLVLGSVILSFYVLDRIRTSRRAA